MTILPINKNKLYVPIDIVQLLLIYWLDYADVQALFRTLLAKKCVVPFMVMVECSVVHEVSQFYIAVSLFKSLLPCQQNEESQILKGKASTLLLLFT